MKDRKYNALVFSIAFLIVGLLWQGLEWLFYGEVQPRQVDNIMISVWILTVIWWYRRGYRHGKQAAQAGEGGKDG